MTAAGCFLVLASLLLAAQNLQGAGNTGTSGAAFLEHGVGSRPLGMGEAFTAEINDINTIYYNPAGLGSLRYPLLSVFHHELLIDTRLENLSFAYPIGDGFIGVSNSIFWVPSFEKVDINGLRVGDVQFYNGCLAVGYGYNFGYFYLGGTAKYIYQQIDTKLYHSFAVDLGVLKGFHIWTPFDAPLRNFHIGLSLQNLGSKVGPSPLPRRINLGMSYQPLNWLKFNMDMSEYAIDLSDLYDFTHGFNESFRLKLGMELNWKNILFLRGGWRFNDTGTYTVGLGVNYAIKNVTFVIDASFADAGHFTPTYSFNIAFKLIPKVITVEDQRNAEIHYLRGIKSYVADDLDSAIQEFRTTRDFNPYHKSISKKIKELEELKKLKGENERDEPNQKPR